MQAVDYIGARCPDGAAEEPCAAAGRPPVTSVLQPEARRQPADTPFQAFQGTGRTLGQVRLVSRVSTMGKAACSHVLLHHTLKAGSMPLLQPELGWRFTLAESAASRHWEALKLEQACN